MESDPHRILEGMAIAGYAVGSEGYIYERRISCCCSATGAGHKVAERRGLLGSRVMVRTSTFASICALVPAPLSAVKKLR